MKFGKWKIEEEEGEVKEEKEEEEEEEAEEKKEEELITRKDVLFCHLLGILFRTRMLLNRPIGQRRKRCVLNQPVQDNKECQ